MATNIREIMVMGSAPDIFVRKIAFRVYVVATIMLALTVTIVVVSYFKVRADEIAASERASRIVAEADAANEKIMHKKTQATLAVTTAALRKEEIARSSFQALYEKEKEKVSALETEAGLNAEKLRAAREALEEEKNRVPAK